MADAELIAAGLLEKLATSSSSGAKKSELESLRNELDVLNMSIDEADVYHRRHEDDEELFVWVEDMKELAELIKGLMEFLVSQRRYLSRASRLISGRGNVAHHIKHISSFLFNIKERKGAAVVDRYLNHSHPFNPFMSSLIRNYLVSKERGQLPLVLIGVSEIGKKTLAKVYYSMAVRQDFDCRAWITVLGNHCISDIPKLLAKKICTSDNQDIDAMNDEEILGTLRHYLQLKRYLLVLDDVWHIMFWLIIKHVLPKDHKRSKIIITTNHELVAFGCRSDNRFVPKILELNSPKYDIEGFRGSNIITGHEKCPLLCFVDKLPWEIRSCLFYFSIFPRESLVPNEKLFKIWIAEGFVQEKAGKTLEEVAQKYLDELIYGELVEPCKEFYFLEKLSRVHCPIHEIVQKEAVEWSFCQIWGVDKDSSFGGKSSRLLISNHNLENVLQPLQESHVRSVFLSNVGSLNSYILVRLFEKYKLLTLLDVENSPLELLPHEVGNLLCLKYLSLKNTKVKMLPKSVGRLQKLQTLDLTNTLLVELPMEIFKLQNLRHLLASRCDNKISLDSAKGVRIKAGIGYLENLQTLMTVEAHLSGMDVIQELKTLRQLRSLSVSRLTTELSSAMCACIELMSHLESLRLHSMNYESLDLQNISSPPPHLERLVLKGLLLKFPDWIRILENLSMLCLSLSKLDDDPLPDLSHLPSLESLWLYRAYEGEKLHFQKGGFRKLKLLVLRDLQELKAIEIEEDALPLLEELRIGPSPLLNEVPSGIEHLRDLKVVSFYEMPNDFVLSMKPDEGSMNWKVERVPSVLIWYRDEGRRYISYQIGQADLWHRLESLNPNMDDFSRCDDRLSFCYSDDEEDLNSASTSTVQWDHIPRMSFSSDRFSFFTDDVEE